MSSEISGLERGVQFQLLVPNHLITEFSHLPVSFTLPCMCSFGQQACSGVARAFGSHNANPYTGAKVIAEVEQAAV